jgi:DNA-binding HxlR family transcriptional regulator
MSVLSVNETYDFNSLKETLQVTDGNLASHLKALEKAGMIQVEKNSLTGNPTRVILPLKKGWPLLNSILLHLKTLLECIKLVYLYFLPINFELQRTFNKYYYEN